MSYPRLTHRYDKTALNTFPRVGAVHLSDEIEARDTAACLSPLPAAYSWWWSRALSLKEHLPGRQMLLGRSSATTNLVKVK